MLFPTLTEEMKKKTLLSNNSYNSAKIRQERSLRYTGEPDNNTGNTTRTCKILEREQ
jgi:hypothetical protein